MACKWIFALLVLFCLQGAIVSAATPSKVDTGVVADRTSAIQIQKAPMCLLKLVYDIGSALVFAVAKVLLAPFLVISEFYPMPPYIVVELGKLAKNMYSCYGSGQVKECASQKVREALPQLKEGLKDAALGAAGFPLLVAHFEFAFLFMSIADLVSSVTTFGSCMTDNSVTNH